MMPASTTKHQKKKKKREKKALFIYEHKYSLTDSINTCWKQSPNGKMKICGL